MMLIKLTTRWNPDFASPQTIHNNTRGHFVSVLEPRLEVILDVSTRGHFVYIIEHRLEVILDV